MLKNKWLSLILWIIIFAIIASLMGQITQTNIHPWYESLTKSSLTPPGIVFSITWTFLYIILAFIGWYLSQYQYRHQLQPVYRLYLIQLLMNWAWTPLFFSLHYLGIALVWLLVMCLLNIVIILMILNRHRFLAMLFLPYFVWLMFASYLNGFIWFYN